MDQDGRDEQRQIWDELYKDGLITRYPWSLVVSTFMKKDVFGSLPGKRVLEYGCGAAANMPFFADMKMRAFGFDFSPASIANGEAFLKANGYHVSVMEGEGGGFDQRHAASEPGSVVLSTCDFHSFRTPLSFDYVLDRGALCCADPKELPGLLATVHEILAPAGLFVFTPFADRDPNNPAHNWAGGPKRTGIGDFFASYLSYNEVLALLPPSLWSIVHFREVSEIDPATGEGYRHWLVVARKATGT